MAVVTGEEIHRGQDARAPVGVTLAPYLRRAEACVPLVACGRITDVAGLTVQATGPAMNVGDLCYIRSRDGLRSTPVEAIGFRGGRTLLMPLGSMEGIGPGDLVFPTFRPRTVRAGWGVIGRVLDGLGRPMDGGPPLQWETEMPLHADPPDPMARQRIREPLATGVRAIDGCVTCGKGQRVGIMSGSGVGKSKLIGMIARNTSADINVIALVGERGREVRDFIEGDLKEEGLARSVVVVATSDTPALVRISGAYVATALAEWFRAQGKDVLLIMDSVTRFAMAQREVGLAAGEPPTTRGYPPSVYALLPRLLERAGTNECGSITGLYAVLVEGDDLNDPVGDQVRSIIDGHVALSRPLASKGYYPAVDVLQSVSRVMMDVTTPEHRKLATRMRRLLAIYQDAEDLVNIGAYVAGSNPEIDEALRLMPRIRAFLSQDLYEKSSFSEIGARLGIALQG